ncbi:hypothetical protein GCM10022217_29870 [Chryseobacterium ginsenosidimutans]
MSINAQEKKEKKIKQFEETKNYISTSPIGIQRDRYYNETKATILSYSKELGEENLNLLLNFNKAEYGKAVKDNIWKNDSSKQDKETANIVYASNLTSRLENYKLNVLEKLEDILKNKK